MREQANCEYIEAMQKLPSSLRMGILIFVGLVFIIFLAHKSSSDSYRYVGNPNEQTLTAAQYYNAFPQDKKTASKVKLGLYIDNLYNLDLKSMSFKARGWLWYNWSKPPLIEGKTNPDQMGLFDFNFIDETSVNQTISSKRDVPTITNAGVAGFWNETSFDAKLSIPSLNLRGFPFDKQKLQILVTSPVHTSEELIYKIQQFRLPPPRFNLAAYTMKGISYTEQVRVYTSNFYNGSNTSLADGSDVAQSEASFNIFISRNPLASLLEYVFPVSLVTFMALSLVRLGKDYWQVKVQAPPAAILSLIFLQNGFRQGLPQLAYLTCMDLIFLLAYTVCMLSFMDGLHLGLLPNAEKYKGLYGKLAIGMFALSPLIVKAWLIAFSN